MKNVSYQQLENLLLTPLAKVSGDFAEIGVYKGDTFKQLIQIARKLKRKVHAFDSFKGMAEPGPLDFATYPKGRLSVGGIGVFRNKWLKNISPAFYELHSGYIPDCFVDISPLSFVYIDVDHVQPTQDALQWAWPRLSIGGMLVLDDYFPGLKEGPSTRIEPFLKEYAQQLKQEKFDHNRIFLKKTQ